MQSSSVLLSLALLPACGLYADQDSGPSGAETASDGGETGDGGDDTSVAVDDGGAAGDSGDTGPKDTGDVTPAPIEHCGAIEADETWAATDEGHLVTCDVEVNAGTLRIEAGTVVEFVAGKRLVVGDGSYAAALVVEGSDKEPVVFRAQGDADSPGSWRGVQLGDLAAGSSLSGLSVENASASGTLGGGVSVTGAEVAVDGLSITGSTGCGLVLSDGARLGETARGVVITGNQGAPACVDAAAVDSLPSDSSTYVGNDEDGVSIQDGDLKVAATWKSLGVPYLLTDSLSAAGTAEAPAILVLEPGVNILVERGMELAFSSGGGASGLLAEGTADAPILISALGAASAGYWKGLIFYEGTQADALSLSYTTIEWAGYGRDAALLFEDSPALLDHVTVSGSSSAAVGLEGDSTFLAGSTALTATASALPLYLPAAAVGSVPTVDALLTGNDEDVIQVTGDDEVRASATWPNLGLTWWIDDDVLIANTAESPAVVVIEAGNRFQVGAGRSIKVGSSTSAGALHIAGSADAPVVFTARDAYEAGMWKGIGVYGAAVDAETLFEHVEVHYAGGSSFSGAIRLEDASPSMSDVVIRDSSSYGIYCKGTCAPTLATITYCDNGSGSCNLADCAESGEACSR